METTAAPRHQARQVAVRASFSLGAKRIFTTWPPDLKRDRRLGRAQALDFLSAKAKPGSFAATTASRGESIFSGRARCATCHVPPLFTEPGWNVHKAAEIGIDDFQANRSLNRSCRTAPLAG